ncbi:TIGR00730 family Rossman fold protein [Aristophania vespae]|uniref:Cytokinin riboside 5'-monophosphate phosphoribohydrolase n=1 Tax=Aristophania vespae TaxID=2697033 RepID=A0A6P1NEP1_9PROT|nr:TIGR00730 family Rossman fold protein [Aristophania vespae]QHI95999.1 TIGR00730 family Rossman fold protein [Aristophania vespae]UMM63759.1 Putative cytokinin riboside 5'-monophosphate phosphoribohydrolase [Aristophania vespae]
MKIKNCTVFCGSRDGFDPIFSQTAIELGKALAQADITLIFGGGATGLMGKVANGALQAGGQVEGYITDFLEEREHRHGGLTKLEVLSDMPARKERLFTLGDAYIILPGGFGTFDEFTEVLVNRQLALHNKPIIILNIAHWADALLQLLNVTIEQGFAETESHNFYQVVEDVPSAIKALSGSL